MNNTKKTKRPMSPLKKEILRNVLIAAFIWLGILIIISNIHFRTPNLLLPYWACIAPCWYILYMLNTYWLMPDYEKNNKDLPLFLIKVSLVAVLLTFVFGLALTNGFFPGMFLFWLLQMILVTPLSWYMYHKDSRRLHQLRNLKVELGKTTADLAFLRSQINPHFLFNALNTLYGTALQENADRTAQGIQKLGDMMRFMLHENMQDNIAIHKEVEYLANYIDLQLLRIPSSDKIRIETVINETNCNLQIAPMLLIPFVENAFKHGISLQEASWVKVVLNCNQGSLYFDVYNSIHTRQGIDPEKQKSGIGLTNVKQRLDLLYPNQHELIIRNTGKEYIVHLTLHLEAPVVERYTEPVPMISTQAI